MKKVLLLWRRLHYNVFVLNKFTQTNIFGLPVLLLLRNKFIKEAYKRRGVQNPEKLVKKALVDPQRSTIIWLADIFMCLLIIVLLFTLLNFVSSIYGSLILGNLNKVVFLIICLVPSLVLNYYALWQNDKYLTYFTNFEKEPKSLKRKWAWISLAIILSIFSLLILSFIIMTKGIKR